MIRFEHLKVYNFLDAIRGMRNSWESWDKMDSYEFVVGVQTKNSIVTDYDKVFHMGENDYALAKKLSLAGKDHAKYLRQILVSVDIIAGSEWLKEADTYKVGTTANSTSMMHKLGSRELTFDDFSFDEQQRNDPIINQVIELCNQAIAEWKARGERVGSPEWRRMQKLIPIGFVYRRTFTANYAVIQNMYHSRKNHRLFEWREFAKWVEESLPYSELITHKFD